MRSDTTTATISYRPSILNAYWAILSARFRTLLQYRAAAVAGIGTQMFWGLIRVMVFGAFYQSTSQAQPMSYPEVVSYIWLSQAFLGLLPMGPDPDVRTLVRSGNLVYELARPMDLYGLWYFRSIANRTAPTVLRCIPQFIIAGLFFGLMPPASWASALAFALALVCAVLLSAAVTNLFNISMLWTISGEGISTLMSASFWLLSGIILPLPFFPDWAQPILNALPFRGLMDTPFRLYMGHLPVSRAPLLLTSQLAWTLALVLLGRWFLQRGVQRMVVQGG